ncbi:hypothetical protein PO768_06565, partial [Paucibacter sp. XJ19-41]|nr:hypothetical protein [Paucibacter sp. XJ19-41]
MAKSKNPGSGSLVFTTLGGAPALTKEQMLDQARELKRSLSERDGGAKPDPIDTADRQHVFDALLLIGGSRGAAGLCLFLQAAKQLKANGKPFHPVDVTQHLQALLRAGQVNQPGTGRGYALDLAAHAERLQALLLRPEAKRYWRLFAWVLGGGHGEVDRPLGWISFRGADDMVILLRLLAFGGLPLAEFERLLDGALLELRSEGLLFEALLQPWLPEAVLAMAPPLRQALLSQLIEIAPPGVAETQRLHEWLLQRFELAPAELSPLLRSRLAEAALHALQLDRVDALLAGLQGASLPIFDAARLALKGDWAGAAQAYEAALKPLRQATGVRRGVLGSDHGRLYVLSLLAQDQPQAWETARKFCIAESGTRKPSAHEWWGLWAHVIGSRLGDDSLDESALAYVPGLEAREHALGLAANRLLLAAWLGRPAPGWTA